MQRYFPISAPHIAENTSSVLDTDISYCLIVLLSFVETFSIHLFFWAPKCNRMFSCGCRDGCVLAFFTGKKSGLVLSGFQFGLCRPHNDICGQREACGGSQAIVCQ
ncbi:hypothetical protein XENORESO_010682 [Xenotaenia resolanae]|uniref:Uncharacterized protein n=1 Tax=Xenotaenia resolanae TaxID=208358 RepID=A0ABV0WAZ5_9TELE